MSTAFRPSPRDKGDMSVDNGDKVSAEESHQTFTARVNPTTGENLESIGVWAVSKEEAEENGTTVEPSPVEEDLAKNVAANLAHTDIVFPAGLSNGQLQKIGKKLQTIALERGCCYSPS